MPCLNCTTWQTGMHIALLGMECLSSAGTDRKPYSSLLNYPRWLRYREPSADCSDQHWITTTIITSVFWFVIKPNNMSSSPDHTWNKPAQPILFNLMWPELFYVFDSLNCLEIVNVTIFALTLRRTKLQVLSFFFQFLARWDDDAITYF